MRLGRILDMAFRADDVGYHKDQLIIDQNEMMSLSISLVRIGSLFGAGRCA